ncbi:MAG: fibronectin type III domain-containing protein [Bacteroidetes bacterium]|nr:fibronectin type III domain-containing protein [Bacteroidota bacterium]
MRNAATGLLFTAIAGSVQAQTDVFQMMERTDLTLKQVQEWADAYFAKNGTGQGSGYKQYQRWLYERKFHSDEKGYLISPALEDKAYYDARKNFGVKSRSSFTWSELGPQSWSYTSGWNPGVGRITSVAVHPSDTTTMYVSSPGGGIWKSTNSGGSWTSLIDFVNSSWMNVFHLCIDPGNTSVIYASLSSGGVIKSTNSGSTWSATGSGPSGTKQVKVFPGNSNLIFAAANNGIWRSTNAGTSWTQVSSSVMEDIEFNPANPYTMYASGSSGTSCVWLSTNGGLSWSAITSASGITATGRTLLAVSPANPAVVYAVQASGSLFGKMYKSTDSGRTYSTLITGSPSSGTNFFGYETNGTGTSGQATYDMAICVNPLNENEVHIAGIICWKSTDGGSTFVAETAWSYPNSFGYNHADVHALEWVNGTIYSGSDGGVYKSINNGNDWIDRSAGLGIRQFYRIACAKTDANVISGGAQDNGTSFRRTGGNWIDWLGADGMDCVISPTNAAVAIGTSQYGSIYKTTNSGASYSNLSRPATGNWITPLVMHPTSQDTVYGGWTGVYRSNNGGSTWSLISGSITGTMDVLAVAPSNTRYIYAGKGSALYRTTNGGSSWTTITAPATITSIFVSKYNPAKIWMTCNSSTNRVYVSTDAGATFTNISSGLPALSARSVAVDEDASGTVYVGMNIGVYYMDSLTFTWAEHATGLPLVAINEVEIQKSGNKLRVATYGRGVWESGLQNIQTTCGAPSALTATSVTSSSATVSWGAVSGSTSYSVQYKLSSDTSWTTAASATTNTSVNLTGLSATTVYDWRVRTQCTSGTSAWSASSFTTLSTCGTPTSPSVTVNNGSVTLSWSAVSGATSYSVDYKLSSSGTWSSTAGSSTNSIALNSLAAGKYDWRVLSNCSSGSSGYLTSGFTVYCSANSSSTSAGYIDYVGVSIFSRTSGNDGGYYNGTGSVVSLKPGSAYTLTFSPGYSGSKKNTYWRGYIDYNCDGDFADAGEQIGQKTFKNITNSTINFTVPSTATLGASRLRVVMSTTAYQSYCGTFSSGEVEDYGVNLTTTPEDLEPGLQKQAEELPLRLFPNPAANLLQVRYTVTSEVPFAEIRVLDLQGRAVLGSRVLPQTGDNALSLDISTLEPGVYYLQLLLPGESRSSSFVIQR